MSEDDHKVQNVDPKEITKFEELAATWWDPHGQSKPLHQINPLRMAFIEEQSFGLVDKKVADIGCGGGLLSEAVAKAGGKVTAIDMAAASIEVARLHALESNLTIDYQQTTAEQLANKQSEQFDIVTCMEMLEHVPQPDSVIAACACMLKPGGWLFLSTLNRTLQSYLFGIIAAEKILKWLPLGTHDHSKFLKPSELLAMTDKHQLAAKAIKGIGYNPLTSRFSLTQSVSVNYLIALQKPELPHG